MADVELVRVSKRYDDEHRAVKDVSLHVADGEFLILVGPSGCGKSTLLRLIAGLEDCSWGEVRIGGEDVGDRAAKDRDIAMVFQSYALYPHMTVRDNMSFSLKVAKLPKDEIATKVDEAARMLDLTEHLDRKPGQLSGGQRQRVAMGRAIIRAPKAFLMDEPLSNLDAKLRVQIRAEIALLQRRLGITTIYVTHDQTEAMTLADRVAVISQGEIQQLGTPTELYDQPRNLFVADFIGSPSMNLVAAEVEGRRLHLPFGEIAAPPTLDSTSEAHELVCGVRPESFSDGPVATAGAASLRFRAEIDVVESLGSELYAYFRVAGRRCGRLPDGPAADALAIDRSAGIVARLDAKSPIRAGATAELYLDPAQIHLFEPANGARVCDASDRATADATV